MKSFFSLVGAGTVAFVGLGWYLDWYRLSRQPAPTGTQRLQVDLNPDKITGDVKTGIERGGEIIDHLREDKKPGQPSAPTPPSQGAASQFFSPPSAAAPTNNGTTWRSLETSPPPPAPAAVPRPPISIGPPRR